MLATGAKRVQALQEVARKKTPMRDSGMLSFRYS
jgi:hypothetical protein